MKIDFSAPLELFNINMPTVQHPYCSMEVLNVSQKSVIGFQASYMFFDEKHELILRHIERVDSLHIPFQETLLVKVEVQEGVRASNMKLVVEKVWFDDDTNWLRGKEPFVEYAPPQKPLGEYLQMLQSVAGENAICYPSKQEEIWVCICGRPNLLAEETCVRCLRNQKEVFSNCNKTLITEYVEKKNLENANSKVTQQEENDEIAIQAENRLLKKKKRTKSLLIFSTVVLLAGATYASVFHVYPYVQYQRATAMVTNQQFERAKETFFSIQTYKDSQTMVKECDYLLAKKSLEADTFDSLVFAYDAFVVLEDYKESAILAKEALYRQAEKHRFVKNLEEALSLYNQVGDYKQASERVKLVTYDIALDEMSQGEYLLAKEKFLSLAYYKDASLHEKECGYLAGLLAIDNEQPLEAIDLLKPLDDYKESEIKLLEAYYMAGEQIYANKEYAKAADYFLLAVNYSDAFRRATQCLYQPAVEAMEAGEYETAITKFGKILTYEDSATLQQKSKYLWAKAKIDEGKYEEALSLLSEISSYEGVQEAIQTCKYAYAKHAIEMADIALAVAQLKDIRTYKDADTLYQPLCYELANEKLENKLYEEAVMLFTTIPTYQDSEEKTKEAQYAYAGILMEQGIYAKAVSMLENILDYEQAQEMYNQSAYQQALSLINIKQYAHAQTILAKILNYSDAQSKHDDCVYKQAQNAFASGEKEKAAELYGTIKGYQDATSLHNQLYYEIATTLQAEKNYQEASKTFSFILDYEDSAQLAKTCSDAYFKNIYDTAKESIEAKDYLAAITAIGTTDLTTLSETYSAIEDMWYKAGYLLAEQLYDEGKPYEAYPYYLQITDYRDVSTKKLKRVAYSIFGTWTSTKDETFVFHSDGTCTVNGKNMFYYCKQYTLKIGPSKDNLEKSYQIYYQKNNAFTFKDLKTGVVYKMTRTEK